MLTHLGADGCWCAPRSSKPLQVVKSCPGGFDSHMLSPVKGSCPASPKVVEKVAVRHFFEFLGFLS